MSLNIYDYLKMDTAIGMVSSASPVISSYFSVAESQHSAFIFTMGITLNASRKVIGQLYQATDTAGTGSKVVTGATCEIEANVKCKNTTVSLNSISSGDTVIINGLTFTAHATTTNYANREFDISGGDDYAADELTDCINHSVYGVAGITATKTSVHLITLVQTIPGVNYITATAGALSVTVRSWAVEGLIEINTDELDFTNGFKCVALQLTPSTTLTMFSVILRDNRYTPIQYFGGEKVGV